MNRPQRWFAVAGLIMTFSTGAVAEGEWKYSTGVDYSTGEYGGDSGDTDITFVPFTVSYKSGQWTFKGSASWLEIEGPGNVIGGGDGGIVFGGPGDSNGTPASTTESGMGDTWLSASYAVTSFPREVGYINVGAKVKLATADEDKGLGTGETDYTLQADYFKSFGSMTPFLTLAYKIKGDPSGIDLDNVLYSSVGSDFRISENTNLGLALDFQESATASGDDSLEVLGYWNRKLDNKWSLMLYGYVGLDDGSPDQGLGFQISYRP